MLEELVLTAPVLWLCTVLRIPKHSASVWSWFMLIQLARSQKEINITNLSTQSISCSLGSRVARPSKDYPLGSKIKSRPSQSYIYKHEIHFQA